MSKDLLATDDNMGKCSLLFCAPEALVGSKWREAVEASDFQENRCCCC